MADVNEIIVSNWLNLCKNQFTLENVQLKVFGPKGGSNYSDIDILAVDKKGQYYNYEIKWRSVYSISLTDEDTVNYYINQLTRKERKEKIKEIVGHNNVKNIFVTTVVHFGKREEKRNIIIKKFNDADIEVIFFEEIVKELVDKVTIKGRYDSEVLQTIRMLKHFNMIKGDE